MHRLPMPNYGTDPPYPRSFFAAISWCYPSALHTWVSSQPTSDFPALLRRHRLLAGLSQEALAERAGLSVRGVSDLERGMRHAPHPATIARLADALDLDEAARGALLLSATSGATAASAAVEAAGSGPARTDGPSKPVAATPVEERRWV